MTREEFLSTLQKTLQGKISGDKVQDNINYYRDYIIEEMKKGKSEEEVFRGLGRIRHCWQRRSLRQRRQKSSRRTMDMIQGITDMPQERALNFKKEKRRETAGISGKGY